MDLIYIHSNHCCHFNEKKGVPYITFPKLMVFENRMLHGFSTRMGGVSEAHLSSMNLSFSRGDKREAVMENHQRFAAALGYDEKRLVFSDQVHKTNFHVVTKEDAGKGIVKESDLFEIDGLITKEKNIPIITFFADCVPIFMYDPILEVIALVHSGWRGTLEEIGKKMIVFMEELYGSKAENICCAIAPSICFQCYEVSEEVAVAFQDKFQNQFFERGIALSNLLYRKENGKYQLNLHKACEISLLSAGIQSENMDITDLCTCCNPDVFFSHRASHGMRGNLAAVMMLKPDVE